MDFIIESKRDPTTTEPANTLPSVGFQGPSIIQPK
jgi:hypothetical protein